MSSGSVDLGQTFGGGGGGGGVTSLNSLTGALTLAAGSGISITPSGGDTLTIAATGGGSGTVTSVALAAPSFLTVSGSPITTAGTLTLALATQVANRVFAGPTNGADAAPTFRALVAADIPSLPYISTTLNSANIIVGNGSNVAAAVAMTGDIGISNAGVTAIQSGVIVNADVNASAAIDFSKLAALTSGNILVGSAGNVATSVTMSGDATIIASGALTIANSAVSNAKLANMAEATIKGRAAGSGTGAPIDLTATQATAILNDFVGDSGAGGTKGLVPAPGIGDDVMFLKGDGTWSAPSGSGDVIGPASSVDLEIVLFDGTTGKLIQSATGSGFVKATSGVYSTQATIANADLDTGIDAAKIADGSVSNTEFQYIGGLTSDAQTQLDNKQPLDATLTALAAYNTDGILTQTAADTFTGRTITGTANQVTVTNGNGVSGNPTLSIPTAFTLPGNMQLVENGSIQLDAALSADGTYSGITQAGTAGATLAFGDLVYLSAVDSRWELTDADAAATAGPVRLGMCVLAAASDGDPTVILTYGTIRADAAFPSLTVGAPAYVSTSPGDIQVAQPSGTDDVIRIVGFANTADELFFNPSNDYITHT